MIPNGICPRRQCRRQCKIFASGVNFSIFTHFLCFFLLKLLKIGEIDGVKFLARKSDGVKFLTNSMSATISIIKNCNMIFQKSGGGVKDRLEFFRKFMRFGSGTLPFPKKKKTFWGVFPKDKRISFVSSFEPTPKTRASNSINTT